MRALLIAGLILASGAGCTRPDLGSATSADAGDGVAQVTASASAPATSVVTAAAAPSAGRDSERRVRDQATCVLDGVTESWRLEWIRPPFPACRGAAATSCTCTGFAPGERGDLDLVRERPGAPADRFSLSPLFEEHETLLATSAADAGVPLLAFADYDHDGKASELVFQVGAGPCGHTAWVVVGVSRGNPKLHVFTSAEDPKTPLVLDRRSDWETVRTKSTLSRVQIACGDHGADESTAVSVTAKDGVLHTVTRTTACPP